MGGKESKNGSKSESRKDSRKESNAESRGSNAKEESSKGALPQNVNSSKSNSGAGVELYRAAPPILCAPLKYGQSRSSDFDCKGQHSGEPALKGSSNSLKTNGDQRFKQTEPQISPEYADCQFPSDFEESFAFSTEEVPLAFGGHSTLPGSPIDPSQFSAAASILGTRAQYYDPTLELSATAPSSFRRDMTDKTQRPATSMYKTTQRSASNADASFQVHSNKSFSPGCVIKLTWFVDSEMGLKDDDVVSDEEFLRRRRARKGKPRMFMLFRTFSNYSMAVQIHTYSDEEFSKPAYSAQHHAIIYSGKLIPSLQPGEKRPANPSIRAETTEELPTSSRLNYAAVFTIEHTCPLAFVGKICLSDWDYFADSYAKVQRMITGYDVQKPSAEPEVDSEFPDPESPQVWNDINPLTVPSTIYQAQPYDTTGYAYVTSNFERTSFPHSDFMRPETGLSTAPVFQNPTFPHSDFMRPETGSSPVQVFQSSTSPGSDASATSTSSSNRHSSIQEGTSSTSSGSWFGSLGSEAPLYPFHAVNPSTPKATEVGQKGCSPHFVNYAQNCLQTLGPSKQLVQSFINQEQTASYNSMKWIQDTTDLRRHMMRSIQQSWSARSLCSSSDAPSSNFVPSRVKVAILDSAANIYGPFFNHCRNRVKGFYDFIDDGQPTPEVTHGVHVASLLMHMAPDIDLYFARVLEEKDASLGAGRLTKAIKYAIKFWKVDIISISAGMHEHDDDLEDALNLARYRRVAVFAATHNHGKNVQMAFPARDPTVIGVSSCDHEGNLSSSAALAKEDKTNFSALGENIPAFWMRDWRCPSSQQLSGSSFAVPIVVGVYATTLLAARLSFRLDSEAKLREKLMSNAVRARLMLVLSMKNEATKYRSLTTKLLWNEEEGWTAAEIKRHIDHVDKGIPYH